MHPETKFKNKILPRLKKITNSYWFVKEAVSLRGIPDLIGCINGTFVGLELKKSEAEARRQTGRIVRQRHELKTIRAAGGYGEIVYPENFEEIYMELLLLAE
jgi:hypothetical protein